MSESKINVQTLIVAVIVSVVLSVGVFTVMKDSFVGPAGEQGIDGLDGTQGFQGIQGIQGESITGPQGERGRDGLDGEVWVIEGEPRVSIRGTDKTEPSGDSVTYLSGVCGEDYRLTSPEGVAVWNVTVTVFSGMPLQIVDIRIFEVVGDYPYGYESQFYAPNARGDGMVVLTTILNPSKTYEVWIRDSYAKPFIAVIDESWSYQYDMRSDSVVGEYSEVSGIVNGDFMVQDGHLANGWYTQGTSGFSSDGSRWARQH